MTDAWQRDLREFVLVAVYVTLSGPVVGLIWAWSGPKTDILRALEGSGVAWRAESGADVHFGLLCVAAGIACAAVVLALRLDGPGAVAGLVLGGLGAAFVANRVGYLLNRGDTIDILRAHSVPLSLLARFGIDPFFKVRALGVLVAWPLAALLVHMLALGLRSGSRSLR